jgi:hypothetical protein
MQFPHIHLNGSAASSLMVDNLNALRVVQIAHDTLAAAAPHARDYYPLGPDAYQTACREHGERLGRLASVMADINAICESINDQQDARDAAHLAVARHQYRRR